MSGRGLAKAVAALVWLAVVGAADAQQGDVISTGGDRFAVGNARKWYEAHSDEVKTRGGGCLSILDEAKVYEDKALALYAAARQPGNRQASALVKQANDQIALRTKTLERFKDCVNQAIRSDRVETSGGKNITRTTPTPQPTSTPRATPTPSPTFGPVRETLDAIVDDCLKEKDPLYKSPDWSRSFTRRELQEKSNGTIYNAFSIAAVAAEQAIAIDERANGKWDDRELMTDYLIGWLTGCMVKRRYLPLKDFRDAYQRSVEDTSQTPLNQARLKERHYFFGFGFRMADLPPFAEPWVKPSDKDQPTLSRAPAAKAR